MAGGSLWTVDQQLSLTDKLPAREREGTKKHKKKDEWNKEWASSAVCDWEGLHFTVKSTAKGVGRGCRSWQIGNERVVLRGGGDERHNIVLGYSLWELFAQAKVVRACWWLHPSVLHCREGKLGHTNDGDSWGALSLSDWLTLTRPLPLLMFWGCSPFHRLYFCLKVKYSWVFQNTCVSDQQNIYR